MTFSRSPFRTGLVTAGLVGSALVLVTVEARRDSTASLSLPDMARALMAPAFPTGDAAEPATLEAATVETPPHVPGPPPAPAPSLRVRAVPAPVLPASEPPAEPAAVPGEAPDDPASPAPALPPRDDRKGETGPAQVSSTPGYSEEGVEHAGIRLSGLDRRIARALLGSGKAALVAELDDGRQMRLLPGASGGYADGRLVPWDAEAAHGFSNWHLPVPTDGSAVPVALLRTRLIEIDPMVRLQRLSFALGPDLHAAVAAAEAHALETVSLDAAALARENRAVVLEGCWADPDRLTVRFTTATVLGGPTADRRRIEG